MLNFFWLIKYTFRYPDDVRDRIWFSWFDSPYQEIRTSLKINNADTYEIPKTVLKSAATPKNASGPLHINWVPMPSNAKVYLYMHFAEIQTLEANEMREFDVILNGNITHSGFSPPRLELRTLYTDTPVICDSGGCNLQLVKTSKSTLPPLINAIEAYNIIEFSQLETNLSDGTSIRNVHLLILLFHVILI